MPRFQRALVPAVFCIAALAAGCGGGAGTPSVNPNPSSSPSSNPSPSSSPSGSTPQFEGGTLSKNMGSSGATYTMPSSDAGYTASVTFGANNATSPSSFSMSWASGLSQITGTFAPGAVPASIGTALLYFDFNASAAVTFNQTPAIHVTSNNAFPGSNCGFAVYMNGNSNTLAWNAMTAIGLSEASPSGNAFSIAAQTLSQGQVQFQPGHTYIALYCH